jgi:hypothetical protein
VDALFRRLIWPLVERVTTPNAQFRSRCALAVTWLVVATGTQWSVASSHRPPRAARRQRVQVDLVPQAGAERLDRPSRVVAAAVETPIHHSLDAVAEWLEQSRHHQGGAGHGQGRLPADRVNELSEAEHAAGIDDAEQRREQAIDQRAVDEPVDVVQLVAQDRHAGSD